MDIFQSLHQCAIAYLIKNGTPLIFFLKIDVSYTWKRYLDLYGINFICLLFGGNVMSYGRMVSVRRDLKFHLIPNLCHGQGHLHHTKLCQAPCNLALNTPRKRPRQAKADRGPHQAIHLVYGISLKCMQALPKVETQLFLKILITCRDIRTEISFLMFASNWFVQLLSILHQGRGK